MSMDYRTYLEHYGVLGMHWGVRKEEKRVAKAHKKNQKALRKEDKLFIKDARNQLVEKLKTQYQKDFAKIEKGAKELYDFSNEDVVSQFYKWDSVLEEYGDFNKAGRERFAKLRQQCSDLTAKIQEDYKDQDFKSPNGFYSLRIAAVEFDEDDGGGTEPWVNIYDENKKRNTIFMSGTEDEAEEFLAHYGVLGMHWGVRKDKNGVRRGKPSKRVASDDYNNTRELKRKRLYELSNAELQAMNQRRQLEENYKKLNPNFVRTGTTATTKLLREIGKEVAKDAIKDYLKPSSAQMSIWNL